MPSCLEFRQALGPLWPAALQPQFIKACAIGTITGDQFNTWLQQDYYFVIAFTRMVGQILSKAPVQHFEALLSGLTALSSELSWFRVCSLLPVTFYTSHGSPVIACCPLSWLGHAIFPFTTTLVALKISPTYF